MTNEYPTRVRGAIDGLLTNPGHCEPELRQSVHTYAGQRAMEVEILESIPEALVAYVDKVVLHAYKVTDRDVDQLKEVGYSEDEIFEITLCASSGAAAARLDVGLSSLEGSL